MIIMIMIPTFSEAEGQILAGTSFKCATIVGIDRQTPRRR